jgi:hypothetical protein
MGRARVPQAGCGVGARLFLCALNSYGNLDVTAFWSHINANRTRYQGVGVPFLEVYFRILFSASNVTGHMNQFWSLGYDRTGLLGDPEITNQRG